jgi:hypothetical protein
MSVQRSGVEQARPPSAVRWNVSVSCVRSKALSLSRHPLKAALGAKKLKFASTHAPAGP